MTSSLKMFDELISFIRSRYPGKDFIALHEPRFAGNEKKYVMDAIDSTFLSSVGEYVNAFEAGMQRLTGARFAVATANGSCALHIAMVLAGVKQNDEVLTQALTFVATSNAISYTGARQVFIDVDEDTLGMSPAKLSAFLNANGKKTGDGTINKTTGRRLAACVPMHTFGLPCRIDEIAGICQEWGIPLVEDAAESLGSTYKGKQTGTFGLLGTYSFNGNKTVTCGGGGAVVTDHEQLAVLCKHLTTQAKTKHPWEFNHDFIGYNYRMPNLNAAVACAQLEQLQGFVDNKRKLANDYQTFLQTSPFQAVPEIDGAISNYWLNAVKFRSRSERDEFLTLSNSRKVMTRPVWTLMNRLPMYSDCQHDGLTVSANIEDVLVNIPSSVT